MPHIGHRCPYRSSVNRTPSDFAVVCLSNVARIGRPRLSSATLPQPHNMVEKRKVVEVLWYLAVLLSIAYIIVAIVAASRLDKSAMPTSKPIGFAVIWSMLLMVCIIVGGTVTMRKLQTPIAVGVFLGATLVFSQLELLLFAIFASRVPDAITPQEASSDRAVAFFSFVLAVIYGTFSVLLFMFRAEIPEAGGTADSYA